jgi:hypothetical protein
LVTDTAGSDIRLRVIGASKTACNAPYVLEVTSASPAGRSRSVQRGTARLQPDVTMTVASVAAANKRAAHWTARLDVTACGSGQRYAETSGTAPHPLP